ncbi:MAG: Sua5/YciO/YrdC/YwlC family protein [Candidatus Krumholzibacteria bacterium]|nr:Sua5/YciO/YrdC/YwlC family protein [Candidatus Krumholzibacteria bacterium]
MTTPVDDTYDARALEMLRSGGVVVLPTDTVYGLHAALSSADAIVRIARLKGPREGRRYIVLADSIDMVARYTASFGCLSRAELARRWPAPLTVVLPAGDACPEWARPAVAFRVPDLAPLRALVRALGEPLVSTSVNAAGEPPLGTAADIERRFGDGVDLVVAGDETGRARASTVVDACGGAPVVLRAGDYAWAEAGGESKPSK